MSKNLFLSVGAMKAGTTWLYDKLKDHPEIYFSPEKELHFFAHQYGIGEPLSIERRKRRAAAVLSRTLGAKGVKPGNRHLLDWYLDYVGGEVSYDWFRRLMDGGIQKEQFIADFSNLTCFLDESAWKDIQEKFDNVKVIYIARDPIKRVWSHYKFHLQYVKHLDAGAPDKNFVLFERILSKGFFIRNARYSATIERLQRVLGHDSFKLLYFEDMISQPLKFLADVEKFAGLAAYSYPVDGISEKKNASLEVSMPAEWREYAAEVLSNEIKMLKKMEIWHGSWSA